MELNMNYDIAVIGAGPGGYVAAIRAAQLGAKVCVIERKVLGGTCLNRGCIPSKVLLHAAKLYAETREGRKYGLVASDLRLDYGLLAQQKNTVVDRLNKGVAALLKANKVTVVEGTGRLTGKRQVTVQTGSGETVVEAAKTIVATGSEAGRPAIFPFDDRHVITTDEALRWESLPASVLIVGAGASGCEFASALRDFGTEVCLVELLGQVLPGLDPDVSAELARSFEKKGIRVRTGTKLESMTVESGRVKAKAGNEVLEADVAIICTGRALNTQGLGLVELSIRMDGKAIATNEHCQTSVPNIYAIGDNTGKSLLAHVAMRQGIVAAEHAMGKDVSMDYRLIPGCVYTDPEIATVGLTEAQAKEQGRKVRAAKFPFLALGKAQAVDEPTGFVKIVADEETDGIHGVQIVGGKATEMIAEAAMAIRLEATVSVLAETIHAHPTLSEALPEAAEVFHGQAIHTVGPRRKP
jgi:dihydrolipoamide dehydrogenase